MKIKILTPAWVWELTSSLPLELYPAWPRVLWLASIPSKRKWDWSSFNDRTRFAGLGPPLVTSSASKPERPSCHRFSERKRLRDDQGRPGKRPLAVAVPPWPPTAAAVADPHPAAAIIAWTTTHRQLTQSWRETRGKESGGRGGGGAQGTTGNGVFPVETSEALSWRPLVVVVRFTYSIHPFTNLHTTALSSSLAPLCLSRCPQRRILHAQI